MISLQQQCGKVLRWLAPAILFACAATAAAQSPLDQLRAQRQSQSQTQTQAPSPPPQSLLANDGLHDKKNPGMKMLQEPREGLAKLPKDYAGNRVNWIKSLREGLIQPRTNILPDTSIRVLNLDVLLPRTSEMPMVLFPHRQHTEWLDCNNCHEDLFKYKTGTTPGLNMFAILQGEFCGQCHGAVAFPLTECDRCHSVSRIVIKKE